MAAERSKNNEVKRSSSHPHALAFSFPFPERLANYRHRRQVGGGQRGGPLLHRSTRAQHQVLTPVAGAQQEQQSAARKQQPPKKDWEAMPMGKKAVELYMGEKGLLFWLNQIAYALIFVITGEWILFRFVSPAFGLYQLDSVPLPPSAMFKGSS